MINGSLEDSNHTLPCWIRDLPCWLWIAIDPTYDELLDAFDLYFPDNCGHIPKDKSILNENVLSSVYIARLRKDGRLGYVAIINGKQINKDVCVCAASTIWTYFKKCLVFNKRDYSAFFIDSVTRKIMEAWKEYENISIK